MSKNIKEIGKELLGKSLNSFHRKTGLTQLEKNNEMQDGILDGILSQVDDAYIEKTEQSNVIHLEGSGDGVVVLDSIEGNTMVNCSLDFNQYTINSNPSNPNQHLRVSKNKNNFIYKENTVYTICVNVVENTIMGYNCINVIDNYTCIYNQTLRIKAGETGIFKLKITTKQGDDFINATAGFNSLVYQPNGEDISGRLVVKNIMILEGDWTNKEVPIDLQGLQSSFEEQIEDDKYKIEILLNNKNLINSNDFILGKYVDREGVLQNCVAGFENYGYIPFIKVKEEFQYTLSPLNTGHYDGNSTFRIGCYNYSKQCISVITVNKNTTHTFTTPKNTKYIQFTCTKEDLKTVSLSYGNKITNIDHKYNKIKLLLNEPLRAVNNTKDRLCIKDNKLVVERNIYSQEISPNIGYIPFIKNNHLVFAITPRLTPKGVYGMCNMFATDNNGWQYIQSEESDNREFCQFYSNFNYIHIKKSRLSSSDAQGVNEWLLGNKVVLVYPLEEPYYEEVLNEYGEPILLEGYENGTLYIDSTIIPTTTVKYTPKMESLNTLKEVYNNNVMLTSDVNDNIIPYMMDVDLMIMEKEMALMSHKNIRKMEVLDMTSMQKRTQEMLERLIKGKSLTEQECKTRITTYLNAGKITDEQAEELMLLIDEVYA